jgi:hypothetical protein
MVKFILIPNTLSATAPFLFNVANISGVIYATTTTFIIYADGKAYTFTVTGGTAALTAQLVNNINKAILATNGPTAVTVDIPTGLSLAAAPAVA